MTSDTLMLSIDIMHSPTFQTNIDGLDMHIWALYAFIHN